jgi:outer membrane biosynthesis protein TonB
MKSILSLTMIALAAIAGLSQSSVTAEASFPSASQPSVSKLPLPDYPEIARKANLTGKVSVHITLDEKGKVVSADNVTGPYPFCPSAAGLSLTALRNSALAAAMKARFQPIDGQSMSGMTGRIIYSFETEREPRAPDSSGEMRLDRMTVVGSSDGTGARVSRLGEVQTGSSSAGLSAQKTVSGGVLNRVATELSRPTYPAAARAVRASGSVSVQVLIAEDGTVNSAAAVSGHPLLRASSELAACASRFLPTLLSGNPVKVSGVITYNYIP